MIYKIIKPNKHMSKKTNILLILVLFLCFSCQDLKTFLGIKPSLVEINKAPGKNISGVYYKYNSDFPPKLKIENNGLGISPTEEWFKEGGVRFGKTGLNDSKEGKWLSGDADFDENGNVYAKGGIWREEYFKNGFRDSIYRRFDRNGKIIYETTFKKGTGLWKEFHSNGQLYFEMYTKDGYFTDTLRIHDDSGKIIGKRLYVKDSLVYSQGLPCFPYRSDSVPSD